MADAKTVNGVDYITADGVAKILAVTPRTVRLYARTGKLKAIKLTGKYLMLPEDVERFIAEAGGSVSTASVKSEGDTPA